MVSKYETEQFIRENRVVNELTNVLSEKTKITQTVSAVLMSLLIILGVLFSSIQITEEIHHHCHKSGCHVCYAINLAKSYINGLNLGENLFYYVFVSFLVLGTITLVKSILARAITLVSLKVKLSN